MILLSCYHPIIARVVGVNADTGKKILRFCSSDRYILDKVSGKLRSERWIGLERYYMQDDFVQIPCGRCIGCQIDRSRDWANRLMMELEYHDSAYFVTLTYDELHVPTSYYGDPETGEAIPVLTLRKRDVQLWLKRLRKRFSNDHIRYYLAAEYGPNTFRPHYHAIVFGLHLSDLFVYKQSAQGFTYYNSPSLAETWSCRDGCGFAVPLGYCVVAPVTWATCAYCARYVTKKMFGTFAKFYSDHNIEPPFSLMSLKPAIGSQWYHDHPDCMDYDFINLKTDKGGLKFRAPGYFRRLYDIECPEESAAMKAKRRRFALEARKALQGRTELCYLDYLELQERSFRDRISSLRRDNI